MNHTAKSILVIDDEDSICLAFKRFFEDRGWQVRAAASASEGLAICAELHPEVVFLDVRLPDRGGLELLEEPAMRETDVVVITAYGGLNTVVQAMRGRAYDYLTKPLDLDKALSMATRILQTRRSRLPENNTTATGDETLVGKSPAMHETYKLIARAAATSSPVLIQGETGTGKELAARAIHKFTGRSGGPFVTVNCGAIPANLIESELFGHVRGAFTGADADRTGRFELADRGTLLLDEVGELPWSAQVKLLRVLDSGVIERVGSSRPIQLDARIIAATNRDLSDEVRNDRFRQDLFYRLAVLRINVPPLRERNGDIELLAQQFLACKAQPGQPAPSLTTEAIQALHRHTWPGNVRELKNAMEHALAMTPDGAVTADVLPTTVLSTRPAGQSQDAVLSRAVLDYLKEMEQSGESEKFQRIIEHVERAMIESALERHGRVQSEAADYLGLHRNTLRNKLRDLGIK